MRYLDEYRDGNAAEALLREISRTVTRPWTMMEVCGSQTHALLKYGIDRLLPEQITLIHGPGCPVCVTPIEIVDQALVLAARPDVIFTSYGDMLRVPGSGKDLLTVKAEGGDVRMVYSPVDALKVARENREKQVIFFAIGFETTAPANAMAAVLAERDGLDNFFMLTSHVLVPPALELIASSPDNRVQGFLAPGHVCTVTGYAEYETLAAKHRLPIVVSGFEPVDLLQAIYMLVAQLESGRYEVENQYARSVTREGNRQAQALIDRVFEVVDHKWRGIGVIPGSGLRLKGPYARFDAARALAVELPAREEEEVCIAGLVLQGVRKPTDCPAFGDGCTPEHCLGAPMVSSEGACAAYYQYARRGESR
ncbi:MAG: hydrogenase formation protein HypD [Dehalococcoidia bacterium]|jgi:hydrogenase expression/formation protein HypD